MRRDKAVSTVGACVKTFCVNLCTEVADDSLLVACCWAVASWGQVSDVWSVAYALQNVQIVSPSLQLDLTVVLSCCQPLPLVCTIAMCAFLRSPSS